MSYSNETLQRYAVYTDETTNLPVNYYTMLQVGENKYYISDSPVLSSQIPFWTYGGNYYLVHGRYNAFLELLISAAYNSYSITQYGYSQASGVIKNIRNLITEQNEFTSLFNEDVKIIYSTPGSEYSISAYMRNENLNTITLHALDGTFTEYKDQNGTIQRTYNRQQFLNITAWANALGFTLSLQKDDSKRIVFVTITRNE